jgi:hypothetical protein
MQDAGCRMQDARHRLRGGEAACLEVDELVGVCLNVVPLVARHFVRVPVLVLLVLAARCDRPRRAVLGLLERRLQMPA